MVDKQDSALVAMSEIYAAQLELDVLAVQVSYDIARTMNHMVKGEKGGVGTPVSIFGIPAFIDSNVPRGTYKLFVNDGSGFAQVMEHVRAYVQANAALPRSVLVSESVGLVVPEDWIVVQERILMHISSKLRGKVILVEGARE